MLKQEFINNLSESLSALPKQEIEERLNFYTEMLDDLMEEGLTEEEAVEKINGDSSILSQSVVDSENKTDKPRVKRKLKAWEIVLISVGSPVWVTLLISAFAVVFSLYVSLWLVIVSSWAIVVALACSSLVSIIGGAIYTFAVSSVTGAILIGAGIACAGIAIFLFFGCMLVTKYTALFTKRLFLSIKVYFTKKEEK